MNSDGKRDGILENVYKSRRIYVRLFFVCFNL